MQFLARTFGLIVATAGLLGGGLAAPVPIMERLDRGVVAVHRPDGKVFISWRLLASDPENTAFNVYRTTAPQHGGPPRPSEPSTVKLNDMPLTGPTWLVDARASLERETKYSVRTVVDGREGEPGAAFTLPAGASPLPYHAVPIETPEGYTPNDASLGDLDGDGRYEIILKQEQRPRDNSQGGPTGETLLQAYTLDGKHLWTINLGKNIREGAHYTMFMVIDLDGDGRAEVACKTADGTVDGTGKVIGDPRADWREPANAAPVASGDRPAARPPPTAAGSPRSMAASCAGRNISRFSTAARAPRFPRPSIFLAGIRRRTIRRATS